jgi:hypothetical protein
MAELEGLVIAEEPEDMRLHWEEWDHLLEAGKNQKWVFPRASRKESNPDETLILAGWDPDSLLT